MDYYYSRYFSPNPESTKTSNSPPDSPNKRNSSSGDPGVSKKPSIRKTNSEDLPLPKNSGLIAIIKTTSSGEKPNRNSLRPSMPGKDSFAKSIFLNSRDSWTLKGGHASSGKRKPTGSDSFSSLNKKNEPNYSKLPGGSSWTPNSKSKTKSPEKTSGSNKNNWSSRNCRPS